MNAKPPYVVPEDVLRDAVESLLQRAIQAEERAPAERRDADSERNPLVRHYRQGLVDGMTEAIKHLVYPLAATVERDPSGVG